MARRQSTSTARSRRSRPAAASRNGPDENGFKTISESLGRDQSPLEQAIAAERGHLSEAESVLVCLHAALLYSDQKHKRDPDFAGVAGIALNLVRKAADSLDSVNIGRLADRLHKSSTSARAVKPPISNRK